MHPRKSSMWLGGAAALLILAGCPHPDQHQTAVAASLRPVDAARPMVVFRQIRGEACGRDAVAGAIRDMKRASVDGYLEVVVATTVSDGELCARVTAYPFRYGTDDDMPTVGGDEPTDPVLVPGRPSATNGDAPGNGGDEPAAFDCAAHCRRIAELIEEGELARGYARDRCLQPCNDDVEGFRACIEDATEEGPADLCMEPYGE